MARTLLLEIGTEEIPSSFTEPALAFMRRRLEDTLSGFGLEHEAVEVFGTPRRLAVRVAGLNESLADAEETLMGPPKRIAFAEDGTPTKAGLGFARNAGVEMDEIEIRETPKGEYLSVTRTIPGRPTAEVMPAVLEKLIHDIPFGKTMRWSNPGVRFARPVHWLVALFGDEVLDVNFGTVHAGKVTRGNRFMDPGEVEVTSPEAYEQVLEARHVIPSIEKRKELIWADLERMAAEVDAELKDRDLLDEVANLLEYPYVIRGSFAESYLEMPREVLVTVMRHHQRFFPLYARGDDGDLRPFFLAVSNIIPKDEDLVRSGNEKVLSARLADADYFFNEDNKVELAEYSERLKSVIFHKDLGTSYEKMERFRRVALYLSDFLAPDKKDQVQQTAYLCKADLNSQMVYELPELQGIMGREYALKQGIAPEVAKAVHEHYLPASADDDLPSGIVGDIVGMADRMDTICGCFGVGLIPSGTSDPFALRRQTIAIENILLGKGYRVSIADLADESLSLLSDKINRPGPQIKEDVLAYFRARFVSILQSRDIPGDVVEAVLPGFDDPVDTYMRARAIAEVKHEPWFASICAASKRVENILKKVESVGEVSADLLAEEQERELYERFCEMEAPFIAHTEKGEYSEALRLLAGLKEPVDAFFEKVLVMSKDEAVRANRLALLDRLVTLFSRVARFSALAM